MDKKTFIIIIAAVLIAILVGGGYFYWSKRSKANQKKDSNTIENAIKGVLPSIQTNPLESKPDLNPADKANPYKNIKTNPF